MGLVFSIFVLLLASFNLLYERYYFLGARSNSGNDSHCLGQQSPDTARPFQFQNHFFDTGLKTFLFFLIKSTVAYLSSSVRFGVPHMHV